MKPPSRRLQSLAAISGSIGGGVFCFFATLFACARLAIEKPALGWYSLAGALIGGVLAGVAAERLARRPSAPASWLVVLSGTSLLALTQWFFWHTIA